jgi:hypothetical protein
LLGKVAHVGPSRHDVAVALAIATPLIFDVVVFNDVSEDATAAVAPINVIPAVSIKTAVTIEINFLNIVIL